MNKCLPYKKKLKYLGLFMLKNSQLREDIIEKYNILHGMMKVDRKKFFSSLDIIRTKDYPVKKIGSIAAPQRLLWKTKCWIKMEFGQSQLKTSENLSQCTLCKITQIYVISSSTARTQTVSFSVQVSIKTMATYSR